MATGRIPTTANSPLTAKGDLFTFSTGSAKLAVGSNGDTLVADSSATTGLRWQGDYAAGKNKIINGDFRVNQRSFSNTTTSGTYGFDRFLLIANGGTSTYSAQTFTAGTAPVAGYEGVNFARIESTGQTTSGQFTILGQKIEDVRTFAGQTVTISFWAKAGSGTPSVATTLYQEFGSGGSAGVYVVPSAKQIISTSWARYSFTVAVPSISGKTIAAGSSLIWYLWTSAGSDFNSFTNSLGLQTATIDIWGLQIEAGSVATAFQTATGTLQGELAACQRYYYRNTPTTSYGVHGLGTARSTTQVDFCINFPVQMRVAPATLDTGNVSVQFPSVSNTTLTNLVIDQSGVTTCSLQGTVASGLTQFRVYQLANNNNTAGFVGFSSEL
jgi:hypothetical protein